MTRVMAVETSLDANAIFLTISAKSLPLVSTPWSCDAALSVVSLAAVMASVIERRRLAAAPAKKKKKARAPARFSGGSVRFAGRFGARATGGGARPI